MEKFNIKLLLAFALAACLLSGCSGKSVSSSQAERTLEVEARKALASLYENTPSSKVLGDKAKGILIFPAITKGGFIVGGQYGEGVLFKNGQVAGYYNTAAGSFGLQAGLQKFGYAMFFMESKDLEYLNKSEGWEVGVGPNITVVDVGIAKSLTTTTLREGVYTFFFGQTGLMAGLGVQGSKISPFSPGK